MHGAVWLAGWLALLAAWRGKATRQAWFASRLVALLIALGATFVKVGQIMSTRPDLFQLDDAARRAFAQYFASWATDHAACEREVGAFVELPFLARLHAAGRL